MVRSVKIKCVTRYNFGTSNMSSPHTNIFTLQNVHGTASYYQHLYLNAMSNEHTSTSSNTLNVPTD